MIRTWPRGLAAILSVALIGCQAETGPTGEAAADFPPVAPRTSLNAVMVGLVDHAAHRIWDLGRDGMGPQTSADWQEVEHHAIQLIAGGTYITFGGTGVLDADWVQQPSWQSYSADVANAGVLALDAANRRDLADVLLAGDSLIMACEGCHQEYKPALPTEGIVHPHHY